MKLIDNLKQRRTYYNLSKTLPVSKSEVKNVIEEITELIPDFAKDVLFLLLLSCSFFFQQNNTLYNF